MRNARNGRKIGPQPELVEGRTVSIPASCGASGDVSIPKGFRRGDSGEFAVVTASASSA
jgi:hypothetical protein